MFICMYIHVVFPLRKMRIPHGAHCNFLLHYFCNVSKLNCSALHMWKFFFSTNLTFGHEIINIVTKLHKKLWVRRPLHLIICLLGGLFLHWCRLKKSVFSSCSEKQEIAFCGLEQSSIFQNLLNALNMSRIYLFNRR